MSSNCCQRKLKRASLSTLNTQYGRIKDFLSLHVLEIVHGVSGKKNSNYHVFLEDIFNQMVYVKGILFGKVL